jgi:hypothetical protein
MTVTELVESDSSWADDVEVRRHRWLRAVAVIAVLVIAVAIGLFGWADRYQPLDLSSGSFAAGGQLTASMDDSTDFHFAGTPTVVNALGTEYRVPTAAGDTVEIVFTISNTGSQPVSIRSFGAQSGFGPEVKLGRFESPAGSALFQPFAPFSLGHGGSRSVVLAFAFAKLCPSGGIPLFEKGGSVGIGSIPVTYSYLGLRHTVDLSLGKSFVSLENAPFCFG